MSKDILNSFWQEIEDKKIEQIPRWRFNAVRIGAWLIVGALGILLSLGGAIALYISINHDYSNGHEHSLHFLQHYPLLVNVLMSLPYVWFILIAVFFLVIFTAVSRSKKGYSYSAVRVITWLLLTTIPLSVVFYTSGIGRSLHWYLTEHYSVYFHLVNGNEQDWTQPENGRLGGKVISYNEKTHVMILKSFHNDLWTIDMKHAWSDSDTLFVPGNYVKILGVQTTSTGFAAHSVHGRLEINTGHLNSAEGS
ncbi:MAG: hypothetical protein WCG19_06790 [Chlorobiaceae bacterium]